MSDSCEIDNDALMRFKTNLEKEYETENNDKRDKVFDIAYRFSNGNMIRIRLWYLLLLDLIDERKPNNDLKQYLEDKYETGDNPKRDSLFKLASNLSHGMVDTEEEDHLLERYYAYFVCLVK